MKLGLLVSLVAAASIAILWILGVLPSSAIGNVSLKTLGVIAVLLAASVIWRLVRGRADVADKSDQPVP